MSLLKYFCFILISRPVIEMTIPSSIDPTLAPPRCHVVHLFVQYIPYTLAGDQQWTEQLKDELANRGVFCQIDGSNLTNVFMLQQNVHNIGAFSMNSYFISTCKIICFIFFILILLHTTKSYKTTAECKCLLIYIALYLYNYILWCCTVQKCHIL